MTASADHLKALVRSHASGDEEGFYSVAMQVAAKAARQGHNRLAGDLRELLEHARSQPVQRPETAKAVSPRGELDDLVSADYPDTRLGDMTLSPNIRGSLDRVLHEQRQRERLAHYGFMPAHRLLLVGPPGTGKSMTAAALAHELSLPLFTIRLDGLISRFMGETSAKLRTIFDETVKTRAVYLFDEFDALGAERSSGNDVGEARRILNTFLLFLDDTRPESLVIAATNHRSILDRALFRRFDLVVSYEFPDTDAAVNVIRGRLAAMDTTAVEWQELAEHVGGLSHAELVRAAETAAKEAILRDDDAIDTAQLIAALDERHAAQHD